MTTSTKRSVLLGLAAMLLASGCAVRTYEYRRPVVYEAAVATCDPAYPCTNTYYWDEYRSVYVFYDGYRYYDATGYAGAYPLPGPNVIIYAPPRGYVPPSSYVAPPGTFAPPPASRYHQATPGYAYTPPGGHGGSGYVPPPGGQGYGYGNAPPPGGTGYGNAPPAGGPPPGHGYGSPPVANYGGPGNPGYTPPPTVGSNTVPGRGPPPNQGTVGSSTNGYVAPGGYVPPSGGPPPSMGNSYVPPRANEGQLGSGQFGNPNEIHGTPPGQTVPGQGGEIGAHPYGNSYGNTNMGGNPPPIGAHPYGNTYGNTNVGTPNAPPPQFNGQGGFNGPPTANQGGGYPSGVGPVRPLPYHVDTPPVGNNHFNTPGGLANGPGGQPMPGAPPQPSSARKPPPGGPAPAPARGGGFHPAPRTR